MSRTAAWVRSETPSLAMMWRTWFLTVPGLTTSSRAIWGFVWPCASRSRISDSRLDVDGRRDVLDYRAVAGFRLSNPRLSALPVRDVAGDDDRTFEHWGDGHGEPRTPADYVQVVLDGLPLRCLRHAADALKYQVSPIGRKNLVQRFSGNLIGRAVKQRRLRRRDLK